MLDVLPYANQDEILAALELCCIHNKIDLADAILQSTTDPDYDFHQRALFITSAYGHIQLVEKLVRNVVAVYEVATHDLNHVQNLNQALLYIALGCETISLQSNAQYHKECFALVLNKIASSYTPKQIVIIKKHLELHVPLAIQPSSNIVSKISNCLLQCIDAESHWHVSIVLI
jgi:hypothetical protein